MWTLAVVVFIAGAAAAAVLLARHKTVADGRVIEADLLVELRPLGVAGMTCDREIPIGLTGAVFSCVATLDNGATQTAAYTMDRAGNYTWRLTAETGATRTRISPSGDPWAK
jgi:hypothetical protein